MRWLNTSRAVIFSLKQLFHFKRGFHWEKRTLWIVFNSKSMHTQIEQYASMSQWHFLRRTNDNQIIVPCYELEQKHQFWYIYIIFTMNLNEWKKTTKIDSFFCWYRIGDADISLKQKTSWYTTIACIRWIRSFFFFFLHFIITISFFSIISLNKLHL